MKLLRRTALLTLLLILTAILIPVTASADTQWTTGAYPNNANLTQQLSIPGASSLIVDIRGTTELEYDTIYILDSSDEIVWITSGQINDRILVQGSSITAGLISDDSTTEDGVSVYLQNGSNLSSATSDGMTIGYYDDGVSVSSILAVPDAYALYVTIDGEVEEEYDWIYLYDYKLNQVGTVTGTTHDSFVINGSSVVVRLVSDESGNTSGFRAEVEASPGLPGGGSGNTGGSSSGTGGSGSTGNTSGSSSGCGWAGTWEFGWGGYLYLTQNGNTYSGNYDWDDGILSDATVLGNTLIGTGTEYTEYGPKEPYTLVFTMSSDCNSFTGYYYYADEPENKRTNGGFWNGTRVSSDTGSSGSTGSSSSGGSTGGTSSGSTYSPASGLVAYYPFDGDTKDYSESGYHGTQYGGSFVSGVDGQALSLDGKDDYVSTPFIPSQGDFTVEAWIKWDGTGDSTRQFIISNWLTSNRTTTIAPCLSTGLSNKITVFYQDGVTTGVSGDSINPGEWYHIAASYDGANISLYMNGELKDTTVASPSGWDSSYSIGRAGDYNKVRYFAGAIDEVRFYNYALSGNEIAGAADGNPPSSTPSNSGGTGSSGSSGGSGNGSTSGSSRGGSGAYLTTISAFHHVVALKSNGVVIACGGDDDYGQVSGVSSWANIVQVAAGLNHTVGLKNDGTAIACGSDQYNQAIGVSTWADIVQISVDRFHSTGLQSKGTVVACGRDEEGQVSGVHGWSGIQQVSAGAWHTLGLKNDGSVVACGLDESGQISGVSRWTDIAQVSGGMFHSVGLKGDGTVVACGADDNGQVSGVEEWTDIKQIFAGGWHTIGLKNDGTVVACGNDDDGQVSGVSRWDNINQLSAGAAYSVGVRTDGTVVACGSDFFDQVSCISDWADIKLASNVANIGGDSGTGTGGSSNTGGTGSGGTSGSGSSGSSSTTTQTSDPLLYAESRTVEPGDTVEVPVRMENIPNVSSLNATISYDPGVLKVDDIYKGSLLSNVMFLPNYSQAGVIKIGFAAGDENISSNGSIAYIEFEAIGGNGDSSQVTISEVSIKNKNGQSVSPQIENGKVTINSKTLAGDYNGDGRVTELDALAALKMSVDMMVENNILDMDNDGEVTAEDAHLILMQAIGK